MTTPDRTDGDGLPAESERVLGFVSDASVAIHDEPIVVWLDSEGEWWGGLPQSFIRLSDHDWKVDRWERLPSRDGTEPHARDCRKRPYQAAPQAPDTGEGTEPVAWISWWKGKPDSTCDRDKAEHWKNKLGLDVKPLYAAPPKPAPDALREALQPFAKAAEAFDSWKTSMKQPDEANICTFIPVSGYLLDAATINYGHCRKAREVLSLQSTGDQPTPQDGKS